MSAKTRLLLKVKEAFEHKIFDNKCLIKSYEDKMLSLKDDYDSMKVTHNLWFNTFTSKAEREDLHRRTADNLRHLKDKVDEVKLRLEAAHADRNNLYINLKLINLTLRDSIKKDRAVFHKKKITAGTAAGIVHHQIKKHKGQ